MAAVAFTWSGGAQTFVQGYAGAPAATQNNIGSVTYYTPGTNSTELITPAKGTATAVFGKGWRNDLAGGLTEVPPTMPISYVADTDHDFFKQMSEFKPPSGRKCQPKVFLPNGHAGLGGLDPGGRCEFSTVGHWGDEGWVQDGYAYTCPGPAPKGPVH